MYITKYVIDEHTCMHAYADTYESVYDRETEVKHRKGFFGVWLQCLQYLKPPLLLLFHCLAIKCKNDPSRTAFPTEGGNEGDDKGGGCNLLGT